MPLMANQAWSTIISPYLSHAEKNFHDNYTFFQIPHQQVKSKSWEKTLMCGVEFFLSGEVPNLKRVLWKIGENPKCISTVAEFINIDPYNNKMKTVWDMFPKA